MRHILSFCLSATLLLQPMFGQGFPNVKGIMGKKSAEKPITGPVAYSRETYENLKNFAEGLYKQKERPEFKLKVDRDYEALLREHADRAFHENLSPHSEIHLILEDRFRVFAGLYDNLLIQNTANRIGQSVVPKWSDRLVTFKLLANPVPSAESLATGTIYLSTGLVASLDNKAQLAYVMAHEAAHVAKDHWKTRVMVENAKEEYARMNVENAERIKMWGTLVGLGAGAAIGASVGQTKTATAIGGVVGAIAGNIAAGYLTDKKNLVIEWSQFEEDEADEVALKSLLEAKVDVRQVPNLFLAMDKLAVKDDRVGMGFWGNRDRMRERLEAVNTFLTANVKDSSPLVGNDPEFRRLMAELKRDNGILSFHFDMLDSARANLEQAVDVRQADPVALYYYGKILEATARTEDERKTAGEMFIRAIQRDTANRAYGAYLHAAITLIDNGTPDQKRQATEYLAQYVEHYRQSREEDAASVNTNLPPHMDVLYDIQLRNGDPAELRTRLAAGQQLKAIPVVQHQPEVQPAPIPTKPEPPKPKLPVKSPK